MRAVLLVWIAAQQHLALPLLPLARARMPSRFFGNPKTQQHLALLPLP